MKKVVAVLAGAYQAHHASSKGLLEGIGIVGMLAFPAFYLLRYTGKLPQLYNDLPLRGVAAVLCTLLAVRGIWPNALRRFYLPYSYFTIFYCLAFLLPFTMLENQAATPSIANVVLAAVLIMLLTDWLNTILMLLAGYVASLAAYWMVHPDPSLPSTFLIWWIPLCGVLVAGGSISKYVEKRAELKRLRRLYAGLAGSIAHEMRTPLAQVHHALEKVALLAPHGSEASVAIGQGQRAVRRGLQAISLTLQQLSAQTLDTRRFEELSADQCVRKALAEYAYEDTTERNKVHAEVEQDFIFHGDETAFTLVLFNLLKNALYYLPLKPEASIVVRVMRWPEPLIVVRDTGPGIAPELMPRLFEEFQTSGKAAGTGLGLAFCRRAMRAIGGDIACRSKAGEFTEFALKFPPAPAGHLATKENRGPAQVISSELGLAGCPTVLIVDDSSLNRAMARERLVSFGCKTIEAPHAVEALRMLREGLHPDVILMDMNMPGPSGLDATRTLRTFAGATARIPVLLVTADPTDFTRRQAFAAGVDGFLVKPLEPELLHAELTRLLEPRDAATRGPGTGPQRVAALL